MNRMAYPALGLLACGAAVAAVLLAPTPEMAVAAAPAAAGTVKGVWTARPSGWHTQGEVVQLSLQRSRDGHESNSSFPVALSDLQGLSPELLRGSGEARFRLVRDAGAIAFEGRFQDGDGAGHFTFSPSAEYVGAMRQLGYKDLDDEQVYRLAIHDVSRTFIRELAALGYERLELEQLVRLRIHGAGPEFIRELKSLGYAALPVEDLVRLRIHGASPDFIRELKRLGYDRLPAEELVRLRIHGGSPEFIEAVQTLGYKPSVEDLVRMRIHGVSPEFIRELRDLGYREIPIEDLVRMRIHGVTPDFVRRVQGRSGPVPVDRLVDMRIHNRMQ